ncbi:MAG: spermidine/putrescine ABC transporter substrate-binding protein, partial [Cyanobacteria bacterium Co-bin8]|nr:spermidine/putrescine ABC transporter substrate-binding protein [Cyanobacteria bacterium Co-bin8]
MPRKRPLISTPFSRQRAFSATRRRFLQGSAAALAGVTLSNCRQNLAEVQTGTDSINASAAGGGAGGTGTLNIYTWADYVDDELTARFTEETGIRAVVDIYDSNETMLAKLQAGGGNAYSILYPSDYMVAQMLEMDLLTELDQSRIKGKENLLDQWTDPVYDPGNAHSVPYSWGTTGLLYNRELVTGSVEDWSYLWDNKESLSRRITLLDDVRETMGAVLKSLGYSYNSTDPQQLEEAYQRLLEIKPHLAAFRSFGFEEQLLGGDLSVVMSYSVDAIAATLEDERMEYIVPASGSSVWTDAMVIPADAPNADAAYAWINFILQPEISKDAVERLSFATPNGAAF